MSVTQTVEVPANHRLMIEVPREIPAGPVILTFTPKGAEAGAHTKTPQTADRSDSRPWEKWRGYCKGRPGASVEAFLADCRADKEREFAIEKREQAERERLREEKNLLHHV